MFTVDTRGAAIGSGTFTGRVTDTAGLGLGGATVTALQSSVLRAQVSTDAGGYYALTSLPAGAYHLHAEKADHLSGLRYGVSVSTGETVTQDFALAGKPVAPVATRVSRAPPASPLVAVTGTQLKVFKKGGFSSDGGIDRTKKTVVFTHGFLSNPDAWAKGMAENMVASGVSDVNLLAWDWHEVAGVYSLSVAVWQTSGQGRGLGEALASLLGAGYDQPIHFIGHSLGTLVNAAAADHLHAQAGAGFKPKRTHVTLLDNAEPANIEGLIFFGGYVVAGFESYANNAAAPPLLVSPLPKEFAWADNYISLVGFRQSQAVNIVLSQGPERVTPSFDVIKQHSYAHRWYSSTTASPKGSDLGNQYSFERGGLEEKLFSSSPYPPATAFSQIRGGPEGRLKRLNSELEISVAVLEVRPVLGVVRLGLARSVELAKGAVQTLGEAIVEVRQALIPVPKSGTPASTGTAGSRSAYFTDGLVETVPVWSLQVGLQTDPNPGPPLGRIGKQGSDAPDGAGTQPPGVWIPVVIPADAAVFSFDFTFNGEPANDILSGNIGGTNVFLLEARFMPTNRTLNSGPIVVTPWAGQTVELFFGLLGGTSTNSNVTVGAMRFYQVQAPALAVEWIGGGVVLSWPATVQGYVLESADSLGSANGWTPVTTAPAIIGLRNVVTHAWSGEVRFFRLRRK